MGFVGRGMPAAKEAVWKHMFVKEDLMKLKWFHKNQKKLIENAERESLRKGLSPEILEEVERMRQDRYRNMERFSKKSDNTINFPDIDPHCIKNIMKPVDPDTRKMLYSTMGKEGRVKYLNERYKIKPEDRFYFPEVTSFQYGWRMFENMKNQIPEPKYGRQQVIKHSFYRRNGALRQDPDFQKPPQRDSPMVCGCI